QFCRAAFGAAVAQLGRDDDAGAEVVLAYINDPPRRLALRVSDQVGQDIGIQHVARHSARSGAGTGSSMRGNSSSSGVIDFSKAIRPRLRTGSITRRSPSRCMMASLPGSSNSTGMRTAWLRPLRNNRTSLSSDMGRLLAPPLMAYVKDICRTRAGRSRKAVEVD